MFNGVPTITLPNGVDMPIIGLGTFQGSFECDHDVVVASVKSAIDGGYRMIDTAQLYNTEAGTGEAIREKVLEGKTTRKDIFVTTKLWNTFHRHQDVIPSLRDSLKKMGLEYVDLFLIHWPVAFKPTPDDRFPRDENGTFLFADDIDFLDTWKGMEAALESGLTRSIGISNFNEKQIKRLLNNCQVKPMNIQIESNPYFNNNKLIEFCRSNGITVTGFSPLGKPSRTYLNRPIDPYVATDSTLIEIGSKYGKSPQQIALRFQVQRGVAVTPKSNTPSRMIENLNIFDFKLTDKEMEQITDLDQNFRVLRLETLSQSREYPFRE